MRRHDADGWNIEDATEGDIAAIEAEAATEAAEMERERLRREVDASPLVWSDVTDTWAMPIPELDRILADPEPTDD
jgi:hypothetical protein